MRHIRTILLLLTLVLIAPMTIQSQIQASSVKELLSLRGEVHILTFFIDTSLDRFETDEADYYLGELLKSQDWLRREAAIWGQELVFDNDCFVLDNRSIVFLPDVPRGRNPRATIHQIVTKLGYDDIDEFLDRNGFDLDREKLKIVLFVKSHNRSHAYNYWSIQDLDLAVIYCSSVPGMVTDQYVVSHEILHQFGAWDLYHELGRSQTIASGELAKEMYPNSIMINTFKDQELLEVDEVTAWRVGWNDWLEEYEQFDSRKHRKQIQKEYEAAKRGKGRIKFDLRSKKDTLN